MAASVRSASMEGSHMTRNLKWLLVALVALCGWNPVRASTKVSSMSVTATVTPGCSSLSVTNLNFGSVPASSGVFDTTATIFVTCAQGVPYSINLGNGNNTPGPFQNARRMADGAGNFLSYSISTDAGHTHGWYDGQALGTFNNTGIGSGSSQTFTAYGEATPQTSQPAGNYSDSVEVDLNF
jgi:spore coat protein U-like protein